MNSVIIHVRPWLTAALLLLLVSASAGANSRDSDFTKSKLAAIDAAIEAAVATNALPGAVFWLERNNTRYAKAYGSRSEEPIAAPMTLDVIFDAASLTKTLATTPAILLLAQRGLLELDQPVSQRLPTFVGEGRERITVAHLLTHTSGLRAGISSTPPWAGYDNGIRRALQEKPMAEAGTTFRYSDVNFILLGELVRVISGQRLDRFCAREIFEPLGMRDTLFNPPPALLSRIAPTERQQHGVLHGVVHDPTARRMDGVAGHAGLFTTAADVARLAREMLNARAGKGALFTAESAALMTMTQTPAHLPARAYGWDINSPYAGPRGKHFPIGSFGHTGWTGTSIWIDLESSAFVILMSNRNHPTEAGSVIRLRSELGTLAAEAIGLGKITSPEL